MNVVIRPSALERVPLKELTRKQLRRLLGSKAYNKNVCKKTHELQQLVAFGRSNPLDGWQFVLCVR